MVCERCIKAVQRAAEQADISVKEIKLGEIDTGHSAISPAQLEEFDKILINLGFERFDDKQTRIIEKVKNTVIEQIHHSNEELHVNWSKLIADQLHYEYNYISTLFSSIEGITIEQFIILQKIEKIRELLFYDELTLSEIAFRLGYSSTAYLTNQFKRITGMTPGQYRKLLKKSRNPIDKL